MRLLFDQNISYRIIPKIKGVFPDAKQVAQLKLENSSDSQIWEYAKTNDYCIVTSDSDFYGLSLVKGSPPIIIWLRVGNTSTKSLEEMIRENEFIFRDFLEESNYKEISCLEID